MRNMIFGGIGVLWGSGVLLYSFLGRGERAGGAYGAGQAAGTVFGFLLLGVGLFYLISGIRNLSQHEPRRKPRKRKRRPPTDDEDEDDRRERGARDEGRERLFDPRPCCLVPRWFIGVVVGRISSWSPGDGRGRLSPHRGWKVRPFVRLPGAP